MAGTGRPPIYDNDYHPKQAFEFGLLGLTLEEMAVHFGVDVRTIDRWIRDHPDFCRSVEDSGEKADGNVSRSLYQRACGYIDKDGREVPPDPRSIEWWLRNRQRKSGRWKDKQEIDIKIEAATESLEARLNAALKQVQKDENSCE